MPDRIKSRSELVGCLLSDHPGLTNFGLQALRDQPIGLDTPATYNVANTDHVRATIARVMLDLHSKCGATPDLLKTFFGNLTAENTAAGYIAQFQGYEWLLDQGVSFVAEVSHAATLRGRAIDLDGEIRALALPVFFDIKSFSFEQEYRDAFKRLLEEKLPGDNVTIDGSGDHGPAMIQKEAFKKIRQYVSDLQQKTCTSIPALGWQIRKTPKGPGVRMSETSFSVAGTVGQFEDMPLRFASQFTTDAPFILMIVPPDGFGSSAIKCNVFNFAEDVIAGIARHVFGACRSDHRPEKRFDSSLPGSVTVADAVSYLTGLAFYSRQAKVALLHLNGKAAFPISRSDAQSISSDWKITEHP